MKQQDLFCEHGTPKFAANGCPQCRGQINEIERLRRENEQLKAENQRLRGQLSTTRTWPDQT